MSSKETLPDIFDKAMKRPGAYSGSSVHFVPNPDYSEFWDHFYSHVRGRFSFQDPLPTVRNKVDPFFGYFGFRLQPTTLLPGYFNIGVDFCAPLKATVSPMLSGILEYSGFHPVNGNYVMVSHPDVCTEDGFVLYSLYMHLKESFVGFTSYQKMLREISLHTYPAVVVDSGAPLGVVGTTGLHAGKGGHVYVHIQTEFRNSKGVVVAVDPLRFLGMVSKQNLTASIQKGDNFDTFCKEHARSLSTWKLRHYFEQDSL